MTWPHPWVGREGWPAPAAPTKAGGPYLYGCSPVCVLRCLVRFADRGKILPQYLGGGGAGSGAQAHSGQVSPVPGAGGPSLRSPGPAELHTGTGGDMHHWAEQVLSRSPAQATLAGTGLHRPVRQGLTCLSRCWACPPPPGLWLNTDQRPQLPAFQILTGGQGCGFRAHRSTARCGAHAHFQGMTARGPGPWVATALHPA